MSAPRFDLETHLEQQRSWSRRMFGPGERTATLLAHIRKELEEVAESPEVEEWIDVVILALEGASRSGASPRQIIETLEAKQAINEARTWPDWRSVQPGVPIEHVRVSAHTHGGTDARVTADLAGDSDE